MLNQRIIGFVEESSGEIERKICAAIQAVVAGPAPTEGKVRKVLWEMECKITSLNFSPHTGVDGEIRGGKAAEFCFTVTFKGREIKGGTWIR